MASECLRDGGKLSHVQADHLAESLFSSISESSEQTESPEATVKVVKKRSIYTSMDRQTSKFWNKHDGVVRMVKSLLDGYSRQPGVGFFSLFRLALAS